MTDLEAVAARRASLVRQRGELETKRAALQAEDSELEVTERVLLRLADYLVARQPSNEMPEEAPAPSVRMGKTAWFPKAIARSDVWDRQLARVRSASRGLFSKHDVESENERS